MAPPLSTSELAELQAAFADRINYESEDPFEPIDPLTYCAPDGDNCLHVAAHRGDLRSVELLIKAGLDVNKQGDMGYTPLHYAATPEVVAFLLAQGASPTIENEFGKSPIGWQSKT
jgi:ankyrin repeat protein